MLSFKMITWNHKKMCNATQGHPCNCQVNSEMPSVILYVYTSTNCFDDIQIDLNLFKDPKWTE